MSIDWASLSLHLAICHNITILLSLHSCILLERPEQGWALQNIPNENRGKVMPLMLSNAQCNSIDSVLLVLVIAMCLTAFFSLERIQIGWRICVYGERLESLKMKMMERLMTKENWWCSLDTHWIENRIMSTCGNQTRIELLPLEMWFGWNACTSSQRNPSMNISQTQLSCQMMQRMTFM